MKKGTFSTVLLVLAFFVGLSLLLYPTVSDYWNSLHQSRAVVQYVEQVNDLDDELYAQLLQQAQQYNTWLRTSDNRYRITPEIEQQYRSILDLTGTGIMGYIEIPAINCSLPIYHGTDESVLQIAIGHLPWSSFPVGGAGTHCVVSGHRGLPSAKLFTDLDDLIVGDQFLIRVLNETLTYEVDQILIVEPQEIDALELTRGEDYCTLVTCTPYGINSHRLLVRGHRVENTETAKTIRVTADAILIDPIIVAPLVAAPMLLALLLALLLGTPGRKKPAKKHTGGTAP